MHVGTEMSIEGLSVASSAPSIPTGATGAPR